MKNNLSTVQSDISSERDLYMLFESAWSAMDKPYVILDLEVTDLFERHGEIMGFHALRITPKEGVVSELNIWVRTQRPAPDWLLQALHTDAQAMADEALDLAAAMMELTTFLGDHDVFIHNAPFDMAFINQAATAHDLIFFNKVFDTLSIAKMTWPGRRCSITSLVTHLELVGEDGKNPAEDDVKATWKVLLAARKAAQSCHAQRIKSASRSKTHPKKDGAQLEPALCPLCQVPHAFYSAPWQVSTTPTSSTAMCDDGVETDRTMAKSSPIDINLDRSNGGIPFANEVLMLDDNGVEMHDFIIIDDRLEIDVLLFFKKEWAAMDNDFIILHVTVTDCHDPQAHILAINALCIDIAGQVQSTFDVLVKPYSPSQLCLFEEHQNHEMKSKDHSLELKQALEALLVFTGERAVFIYKEPDDSTFIEDACFLCGVKNSMQLIDVAGLAQFPQPSDHTNSFGCMAADLGIPLQQAPLFLDVHMTLKILLETREKCRRYHYKRITSTAPRLKNGCIKEILKGEVFCRFCQKYHPIVV